ncbi:MAG: hypothetical protein JSV10_01040, partial [Candidatus Zixiibacteriota bacterium]
MRKKVIFLALCFAVSLILVAPELALGGPDGGDWLACVKSCGNSYRACYTGCDFFDDECWAYCLNSYMICLSS